MEPDKAVIVFDGDCVLCSRWVRFLLTQDTQGLYRLAAMQGEAGRTILTQAGLDPDDPSSFVLLRSGGALRETTAILAVLKSLAGPWPVVARMISAIPRSVRDRIYFRIARNRYRLFGKRAQCYVPSPDDAWRFLK